MIKDKGKHLWVATTKSFWKTNLQEELKNGAHAVEEKKKLYMWSKYKSLFESEISKIDHYGLDVILTSISTENFFWNKMQLSL